MPFLATFFSPFGLSPADTPRITAPLELAPALFQNQQFWPRGLPSARDRSRHLRLGELRLLMRHLRDVPAAANQLSSIYISSSEEARTCFLILRQRSYRNLRQICRLGPDSSKAAPRAGQFYRRSEAHLGEHRLSRKGICPGQHAFFLTCAVVPRRPLIIGISRRPWLNMQFRNWARHLWRLDHISVELQLKKEVQNCLARSQARLQIAQS